MELLAAWEQWTGPVNGLYRAVGVSAKGMASAIGKAKKLSREGHFPAEEFKEIKVEAPGPAGPCAGIELCWAKGRIIRFPQVDQLLEFLKKAA